MTSASYRGDVLALLGDREAMARLGEALRFAHAAATPHRVERVAELRAALAGRRWDVVLVEARDADLVPTDALVQEIRATQPDTVVVGYARRRDLSSAILDFARAGVHELVVEGVDDGGIPLRRALESAAKRATADQLTREASAMVPPAFRPVVQYCLAHVGDAASVTDVARAFGVSRQALTERARRARFLAPREIIMWCRLLLAARLLAGGGETVDNVAITLHFPSANGLRNVLRRYTTLTIQDVRDRGVAPVLAAFGDAIAAERATAAF